MSSLWGRAWKGGVALFPFPDACDSGMPLVQDWISGYRPPAQPAKEVELSKSVKGYKE